MDSDAKAYFKACVLEGLTLRAIRRLMESEGYDLSEYEDSALIREMLEISDKAKETLSNTVSVHTTREKGD